MAAQPDGCAWLILSAKDFWQGVRQALFPGKGLFLMWGAPALINILFGGTKRSRALRGLAAKCGVDADGLERCIATYNELGLTSRPDPLGKFPALVRPFTAGTWFAVNVSLSNKFAPA